MRSTNSLRGLADAEMGAIHLEGVLINSQQRF